MERHTLNEAADWFVRLQDQKVTAESREKFANWLLLSPDHIAAYMQVSEIYGAFGAGLASAPSREELVKAARESKEDSNVVSLITAGRITVSDEEPDEAEASAAERSNEKRRVWNRWVAAAASVVAISILVGMMVSTTLSGTQFATDVGEQRSVPLEDGSLLYLNTDSHVKLDFSKGERRISLTRGEARFTVAKDANRPFIVSTRHASVRALGTIFNVHTASERTAVSVIEGRIVVTGEVELASTKASNNGGKHPEVVLQANEGITVTPAGDLERSAGASLERVRGWPNGRLVFREEPLADLVRDFNRYHKRPLRIADAELAGHRVSGTFDAYDRSSLLQFLERYEGVRVTYEADGSQLLSRADASRKSVR
jgi:transmembrane sensor